MIWAITLKMPKTKRALYQNAKMAKFEDSEIKE